MHYKELCFPADSVFLVTGGAGFIGSNLCEAILGMGYRVRCLDDLSTGKQENVDMFAGKKEVCGLNSCRHKKSRQQRILRKKMSQMEDDGGMVETR